AGRRLLAAEALDARRGGGPALWPCARRPLVPCRHAAGAGRSRACAAMNGVYSIAIDRRFADDLAAGVLAAYGGEPLALADVLILLPTRRSVRALREAFLRTTGGTPTLLPRMAPLGDLDDAEW